MRIDLLKKESKRWLQEGIIDVGQRDKILSLYPEKTSNTAAIIFSVVGAILIGAGIILIFAFNWDSIPVYFKLCISFLPLLLSIAFSALTMFKYFHSVAFRETAGIFLSLGIYAAMSLISQTFHDQGDIDSFILLCSLAALPGVYFLKSLASAAIYSAGALYSCWQQPIWFSFLICAAILPFFILNIYRIKANFNTKGDTGKLFENKFSLSFSLFLLFFVISNFIFLIYYHSNDYHEPLNTVLLCIISLFLLDSFLKFYLKNTSFSNPSLFLSKAVLFVIMLESAASSSSFFVDSHNSQDAGIVFLQMTVPMLSVTAAYIYLNFKNYCKKKFNLTDLFIVFCLVLHFFIHFTFIPANIMVLCLGIYYILLGARKLRLKYLNFGMFFIMYIIILRFFDIDLSLLLRGIMFILLGIIFIISNILLFRKKKAQIK